MAQYTVNHTCGHTSNVALFGPMTQRENRLAYLATIDCTECQRAREKAANEAATSQYALVELTGSEKQVAWANDIRAKAITALCKFAVATFKRELPAADVERLVNSQPNAKFWIDNRDMNTASLIKTLSK